MFKFLTAFAVLFISFFAQAQKLSLLTAHVVLQGNNSTYESGDSTAYYYSGLRGHGGVHHSTVNYDSAILFKIPLMGGPYGRFITYYKSFDTFDNTVISISALTGATVQKDSNTYNLNNDLVLNRHSSKPNSSSVFTDDMEAEYFYNADSTLNWIAGRLYDINTSSWYGSSIDTYVYANKKLAHRLIKHWQNSAWINSMQFFRTYAGNNVKELTTEQWVSGSYWMVGEKHIYNYNNNDLLIEDSMGSKIDSFFYDANDNLIKKAHWTITSGKYLLWKDSFEYDTLNRLVLRTRFTTPPSGPKWYSSGECGDKYYYNDTPAVVPVAISAINANKKLVLYPNPATKDLHIEHSFSANQAVQWSIVNAVGRIIRQWETTGDAPQVIALSHLPPGVYYLTFASESDRGSGQFVLVE